MSEFESKYVTVTCTNCEAQRKIYTYTKNVIKCSVCDKKLAQPTGSYFKNLGSIYDLKKQ